MSGNPERLRERPRIRKLIAERGLKLVPGERFMVEDREGERSHASDGILKQLRKQAHEATKK